MRGEGIPRGVVVRGWESGTGGCPRGSRYGAGRWGESGGVRQIEGGGAGQPAISMIQKGGELGRDRGARGQAGRGAQGSTTSPRTGFGGGMGVGGSGGESRGGWPVASAMRRLHGIAPLWKTELQLADRTGLQISVSHSRRHEQWTGEAFSYLHGRPVADLLEVRITDRRHQPHRPRGLRPPRPRQYPRSSRRRDSQPCNITHHPFHPDDYISIPMRSSLRAIARTFVCIRVAHVRELDRIPEGSAGGGHIAGTQCALELRVSACRGIHLVQRGPVRAALSCALRRSRDQSLRSPA